MNLSLKDKENAKKLVKNIKIKMERLNYEASFEIAQLRVAKGNLLKAYRSYRETNFSFLDDMNTGLEDCIYEAELSLHNDVFLLKIKNEKPYGVQVKRYSPGTTFDPLGEGTKITITMPNNFNKKHAIMVANKIVKLISDVPWELYDDSGYTKIENFISTIDVENRAESDGDAEILYYGCYANPEVSGRFILKNSAPMIIEQSETFSSVSAGDQYFWTNGWEGSYTSKKIELPLNTDIKTAIFKAKKRIRRNCKIFPFLNG